MGFIKDFFKIEERRMWKEVISQLPPDELADMTKRDFLRPSTPEMKDKVEFLKRRVSDLNTRASQADKQYADGIKKTLEEAAKGKEDYDRHISEMQKLGNHDAHIRATAQALDILNWLEEESTQKKPAPYGFDPNNQRNYERDTTSEQRTSGRGR